MSVRKVYDAVDMMNGLEAVRGSSRGEVVSGSRSESLDVRNSPD
jgi:hypothetical protein